MRRAALLLWIVALAVLGARCSFALRPVPVDAPAADWENLAGHWRGRYTIDGPDRRGVIEFRLNAREHEASGDVLMIADRFAGPLGGTSGKDEFPRQPPTRSQLLGIRFVAADHGMIRGQMVPYWDPDRKCEAWASFLGSADGDVIAGSFISVCEDGARVLKGRWRVERNRS